MSHKIKESDLFPAIREFFEKSGHVVYSEVNGRGLWGRADVVATHGNVLSVIEMKTSLTMDLLEQAYRWKECAHVIYIAIPERKRWIGHLQRRLIKDIGIGLLTVKIPKNDEFSMTVTCEIRPKLNRKITSYLRNALCPEFLAGSNLDGGHAGGGYTTPYSITIEKIKEQMKWGGWKTNGWMTAKDIIEAVESDTHWAAPRSSVVQALRSFEKDWCEEKKEGGRVYFRHLQAFHREQTNQHKTRT